jgi:very-short-patch-repair endonuclease
MPNGLLADQISIYYCEGTEAAEKLARQSSLAGENWLWIVSPQIYGPALLQAALNKMAEAALASWPRWHSLEPGNILESLPATISRFSPSQLEALKAMDPDLDLGWLTQVLPLVRQGRPPTLSSTSITNIAQMERLALATGRIHTLALTIAPNQFGQTAQDPDGWGRMVENIALRTGLKLIMFLPSAWAQKPEIERLASQAKILPSLAHLSASDQLERGLSNQKFPAFQRGRAFQKPEGGKPYQVDFFFEGEKLAALVDSFPDHESLDAFKQDREQNFYLLASGYQFLRLTDEEIFQDTTRALEKIAALLALSRTNSIPPGPKFRSRGQPSSRSVGEQNLAILLTQDERLGDLFYFNKTLTIQNNALKVDFIWPKGRLVIEVDGYIYHRDRDRFNNDRNRDWLLATAGYRVLRLTADEVCEDLERAFKKVRRLVELTKLI